MVVMGRGCVMWSLFHGRCGICGQSFVAIGDHCGQLSPFVIVAMASRCRSCMLLVVVRERKATSCMITKQRLFVMCHK